MDTLVASKFPNLKHISPLRYAGGKSKLARHIGTLIGPARELREVFAGGASVSLFTLATSQVQRVQLNDADEHVAAVWKMISTDPEALITRLLAYRPSKEAAESYFRSLYPKNGRLESLPDVEFAFRRLIVSQQCYSGKMCSGMTSTTSVKTLQALAKRIRDAHRLLRGSSVITSDDFEQVIRTPGDDVALYLDPPYVKQGKIYQHSFSDSDHRRLAGILRETRHRWVLSYDDHKLVRDLYGEWCDVRNIADYKSYLSKDNSTIRAELLITPLRRRGRPARDDHTVLDEIVAVLKDGDAWRRHRTALRRYKAWKTDETLAVRLQQHVNRLANDRSTASRAMEIKTWLDTVSIS